ncbi:DUF2520 domain-containing protein [Niabella terrae]
MKLVILGSGNIAAVLGRKFVAAGHQILQIISRNASTASELAYEWDTESANYLSLINRDADCYLFAVSDEALPGLAADLRLEGKVVAHTAGAVAMEVLAPVSGNYGVFYPLQSIRKEQQDIPELPIYIEAANEATRTVLTRLASSISGHAPLNADLDKRSKLHLAAVLVNNFTNHLFSLTEAYCKKEGIAFRELLPLVENTFSRLQDFSPAAMQTGPAARGDETTIEKHLELLSAYPKLRRLYQLMTESISMP